MLLGALTLFIISVPGANVVRNAVFDSYQRWFPAERTSSPVFVVLVDENALKRYGQWPWPRTRVAELFEKIAALQPGAIGVDMVFPEPDRYSPAGIAAEFPVLPKEVRRTLESLPSNDQRFAEAIKGKNVVLGISGETSRDSRFSDAPRAAPVVVSDDVIQRNLRDFPGHIRSIDPIDSAAESRGAMNSGPADQVVRQVPLVVNVQNQIVPSLGVESLRVALHTGLRLDRRNQPQGLLGVSFGSIATTAQEDGSIWLRYGHHDDERFIPAVAVMDGKVDPGLLKGRVVLVGLSGLGLLDFKTTPLGEFVPGVEIHAQVIENLVNGVSLKRPTIAPRIEAVALLLCGFILIAFVPRLSALQGINLAAGLVILLLGGGVIAFLHFSLLLDPVLPALGTVMVFGSVVVGTLSEAEKQRRQLREQAAHMAGEVNAARRIQMGLLVDADETLGGDKRFRVATLLEPARTVGGDFYDCFMVDETHLFIVVADVAGKGLPAALFMAAVKSHIKSAALRGGPAGDVLTNAQDEISRENPEQLFVTAFAASLDVQTGEIEYANAGHEPPFLRAPHGAPERMGAPGGPPLCVVENYRFPTDRATLKPGDWMMVMTDGATEAQNVKREFFGIERLRTSLSWIPDGAPPTEVVKRVRDDVGRFMAGAELADDITLVAVRWDGGNAAPSANVDLDAAVARL